MCRRLCLALGSVVLASSALCWAQGTQIKTAPQVVAGAAGSFTFVTRLTFQNRLSSDCGAEVLFHRGPGEAVDAQLLVNGQSVSSPFSVSVPGNGTFQAEVTLASEGLFEGAARITDECGQLAITAGYDIVDTAAGGQSAQTIAAGETSEIFNYPVDASRTYTAGNAFLAFAPIDYQPGANSPGVAVVADPERSLEADLCFDVLDSNGSPVTEGACMPYDGSHTTLNLTEVFDDLPAVQGQWMVWTPSISQTYVNILFIDVELSNNQFRQTPHIGRQGACLENSPPLPSNPCLNNYRFSVNILASAGTSMTAPSSFRIDDTSALFQFPNLGPDDFNMTVQVIDGCSFNQHYWVFASANTDVEYRITVTDLAGGRAVKEYTNVLGQPSAPVADTMAFATCP